jgi:hypothetical protein
MMRHAATVTRKNFSVAQILNFGPTLPELTQTAVFNFGQLPNYLKEENYHASSK